MMYCLIGAAAVATVSFVAGYLYKQSRDSLARELLVAETDFNTTFKAFQKINQVFLPGLEKNEEERMVLIGQIRAMAERFLSDDDQTRKAMHDENTEENLRMIEFELEDILPNQELLEKYRRFRHEMTEIEQTLTIMWTEKERMWQEQRSLWFKECNDKINVISELRKKMNLGQGQLDYTWNRLVTYAKRKR